MDGRFWSLSWDVRLSANPVVFRPVPAVPIADG